MRARLAILIALVATISSVAAFASPAPASELTLAQETDGGDEDSETGGPETEGGSEDSETEGTTQQGGTEDEEGESPEEGEAAAETGPPWTYQMARIALVLLVLTLAGVAFAYYRFVATRRREGF
ncbi:MAG: hypothetical protein ACRDK3_17445 [Actinomycetota bacterium]